MPKTAAPPKKSPKKPAAPARPSAPPREAPPSSPSSDPGFHHLAPAQIIPSPNNPRHFVKDQAFVELVESISRVGILQPLVVRPHPPMPEISGTAYELLAGERRFRAAIAANLLAVPCIVRNATDAEALEITVTENLHRTDLSPLEEARGVHTLLTSGAPAAEIAARLGKSPQWVHRRASLTRLIPEWIKELQDDESPWAAAHVRSMELLARQSPENQRALLAEFGARGGRWNAGQLAMSPLMLSRALERYEQRLAVAPFDPHDHTLVPAAGSCAACPHRSSVAPDLFDTIPHPGNQTKDRGLPAGDQCLSAACWLAKGRAAVARKAEKLAASGKPVIVAPEGAHDKESLARAQAAYAQQPEASSVKLTRFEHYNARPCKASDPGAVAVIRATGSELGKVYYYQPPTPPASPPGRGAGGEGGGADAIPIEEKIARVHSRRIGYVITQVTDHLHENAGTFEPDAATDNPLAVQVPTDRALALAAHFGMISPPDRPGDTPRFLESESSDDDPPSPPGRGAGGEGVELSLLHRVVTCSPTKALTIALNNAVGVLAFRLSRSDQFQPATRERELQLITTLLGINLGALLARAAEEIPFPKSWRAEAEAYLARDSRPFDVSEDHTNA